MVKIRKIKKNAVAAIKKCWVESIIIGLLNTGFFCADYILIILVGRLAGLHTADTIMPVFDSFTVPFGIFTAVTVLIAYLAYCPFYFGTRWFFWQAAGGSVMPLSSVFACYGSSKTILRCIALKIVTDLRRGAFTAVFAGIILLEFNIAKKVWIFHHGTKAATAAFVIGLSAFALCIAILYIAATLKYMPVGYLMADNPYSSIKEILSLSKSTVSKKYTSLLGLYFSSFGWIISCVLMFPIPMVIIVFCMYTASFLRESFESDENSQGENVSSVQPEAVEVQ